MPGLLREMQAKSLQSKLVEATETDNFSSDAYFESYSDLEVHRTMLSDSARTNSYRDFILNNGERLFKGKVVMDLGSGTGILALFCAKAGAARVFAVEPSRLAKRLATTVADNGFSDVITVVPTPVESVDAATIGVVDVIVSEWMGHYLVHESMLQSVIFARDNFLRPESGLLVPSHARLMVSPTTLESEWQAKVGYWLAQPYGLNMSSHASDAMKSLSSKPLVIAHSPTELLASDPDVVCDLNLYTVSQAELSHIESVHFVSIDTTRMASEEGVPQSAVMRSISLWFDVAFTTSALSGRAKSMANLYDDEWSQDSEVAGSVTFLRSGPSDLPTHWKQTCIVWPQALAVDDDQVIGFRIILHQTAPDSRSYLIQLEALDPATERHPVPCHCGLPVCALVQAQSEEYDKRDALQIESNVMCE